MTILVLYAVTDSVTNNVLAAKKDRNQPHITFSSPDYDLEKIKVDVKGDSEGWSETARWENVSGDDLVYVHIFAHVTYDKLIMSSHVRPPDKRIYRITGGKTVSLGTRGKAEIERGFYEYQAYSVEEVPCIYIHSYWGDRSFSGVDVVRGAKASDKIVGNHMLQVVVCDQRKKEIGSKDVTEILSSIDLRDAHWSTSWFVPDIEPATSTAKKSNESLNRTTYILIESDEQIYENGQPKFTANRGDILEVIRVKTCISGSGICWQVRNTKTGETGFRRADVLKQRHTVLYEEKAGSTSDLKRDEPPTAETESSQTGFTGTYNSEISGKVSKYIKSKNPEVELVQSGNTITGIYGDSEGEIWGKVVGNTVEFDWKSSINAGYGTGKWTFKPGTSKVRGTWFTTALGSGDWNLFRQDVDTGESLYENISGIYDSEITYTELSTEAPELRWIFGERPDIQVRIEQKGDTIIGEMLGDRLGKIKGVTEGDKISYEFEFKVTGGVVKYGNGTWRLNDDDQTMLNGTWEIRYVGRLLKGNWNLRKIE